MDRIIITLSWNGNYSLGYERKMKAEYLSDDTESTKRIPKIAIITKANINLKPKSKEAKN